MGVMVSGSFAQYQKGVPARAKEIGVDEKLGGFVPLDLPFEDEQGKPCKLRDLVDAKRPIVLTLNYSDCPGLCVAQLDGLVNGLEDLAELSLGKDFQVVSISIDPRETAEKARRSKEKYTLGLSDRHDRAGWHFWTGSPQSIQQVAEATGFRYTYDKANDRYNHAAMAAFLSSQGRITRYLFSVDFEPSTLKMAFLEASEGKIGTPLDQILLWCMHFDANENRYSADARKLLSLAAGVFVVIVIGASSPFWFFKAKSPASQQVNSELSSVSSPAESAEVRELQETV